MFGYRHAYHAGNFADVLKHSVLAHSLEYLIQKPKPVFYLDTHAGAGTYSLDSKMAQKTAEHQVGIVKLWSAQNKIDDFLPKRFVDILSAMNGSTELKEYPGSPRVAAAILRDTDLIRLFELHSTDFPLLRDEFARDRRIRVEKSDGFAALKTLLPPPSRRGLVMIDPAYENKDDYHTIVNATLEGYRRFATGVYMLWYPVVQRSRIDTMAEALRAGIPKKLWQIELQMDEDQDERGMTAAGLFVINPPYTLIPWLETWLPKTSDYLSSQRGGYILKRLST